MQTTYNFELFEKKKALVIFDEALTPLWKKFLLKQLFDAKLLIKKLPSFSVPKTTEVRHA